MRTARFAFILLVLLLTGRLGAEEGPKEFLVGGYLFSTPKNWVLETPSSPMRKAELKFTDEESKASAETVFFCFGPGQGGSPDENINRWKAQFTDLKSEKVKLNTVGGVSVTTVRLVGTYQSGMPGGPKLPQPGTLLLGAMVPGDEGMVFVRLTGPAALVEKIEKDFAAMIESGAKNKRG